MKKSFLFYIGIFLLINIFLVEQSNVNKPECCGQKNSKQKKRSVRHINTPQDKNYALNYPNEDEKVKRSNEETKDNTILLIDSSNGFERAIENDIDELNNPIARSKGRSMIEKPFNRDLDNQESVNSTDKGVTKDNQPKPSTSHDSAKKNEAYDLLAQTAMQYSNYLLDEMRILSQMENENTVNNNQQNNEQYKNPYMSSQPQSEGYNIGNVQNTNQDYQIQNQPQQNLHSNNGELYQIPPSNNGGSSVKCGQWSDWGPCNETCGNGISMRYRECYNDNNKKIETETKPCVNPECLYCSTWTEFTSCTKVCGTGMKSKSRNCYFNNGKEKQEKIEEQCNTHPCLPECGMWSDWSSCSKPCDSGVTVRNRTCILADGSPQTFYEQHACNTDPCNRSPLNESVKNDRELFTYADQLEKYFNQENGCLTSHISFESIQYNVQTYFDKTDEHNDVEYEGTVNFKGNKSCGHSIVFTGASKYLKYYDDMFRNFEKSEITGAFWFFGIENPLTDNSIQTLFSFSSTKYNFGEYNFYLDSEYHIAFQTIIKGNDKTVVTDDVIPIGKWVHLGATYSKDTDMEIYINGRKSKVHQANSVLKAEPNRATSTEYQAFGNDKSLKTPLSGLIDEVYVSKCYLEAEAIRAIANTCRERESQTCPSPLGGLCSASSNEEKVESSNIPSQTMQTPLFNQA